MPTSLRRIPAALASPALLLLASCASSPPPPAEPSPPVASPPPVASTPPPPPSPSSPAETPFPPTVALDAAVACTFDTPQWRGIADITDLSLRPGGKPFARITGGAGRLSVPTGSAGDTVLEIKDGGITVGGHVPAAATAIRPHEPFVMNGFAIPTIFAHLAWSEGAAGSLTVTHAGDEDLEVLDPPLRATRPCGDLGLEGGSFVAEEAVPGGGESKRKDVKAFAPGSRVELSSEPKGKPVARIAVKEARLVDVFESRGGMSRVSFAGADMLIVFGWVKTSDLKPAPILAGYGSGGGRRGPREPAVVVKERLRCEKDVPLVAEVEGERRTVGAIGKSTPIDVLERADDAARVRVWTKAIHAAEGASFLVRAFDLSGCTPLERQQ
ncbi:hypothetical protein [Polyangium aurulentum]|uniref:hypothetical protein n=1 Tax=Polyangium aurulentum TaxID=2567896 RepID=UPI0010AEC7FC|nr:hypothetical protein [Polyangium aurulentum]UQA55774.1 hypothetical protein E8A73_031135 [Polyangium aurulentum]